MRLHFVGLGAAAMLLFATTQASAADDPQVAAPATPASPAETPAAPPPTAPPQATPATPAPTRVDDGASPALPAPAGLPPAPSLRLVAPRLSAPASSSCAELPDGCPRVASLGPTEREAPRGTTGWYGHQTLLMDGVTLGVGAIGLGARSAEAGIAATIMYGVGVPLVHIGNGHPWMALASLATRASAPFVGGFTGALVGFAVGPRSSSDASTGPLAGFLFGSMSGALTAVILDAAVYSNERKSPPSAWDGKPTIAPTASVTHQGASIGLGGAF